MPAGRRQRLTCTRCSRRRKKCDRKDPCSNCVKANVADSCSREWPGEYNASVHRIYLRSRPKENTAETPTSADYDSNDSIVVNTGPIAPDHGESTSRDLFQSLSTFSQTSHPSGQPSNESQTSSEPRNNHGLTVADVQKYHLQTLIPSSMQIMQLVEYHEAYLLWYHNSVHGPTFRTELSRAMQASDGLQLQNVGLQWGALLFAVMAASLTCANDSALEYWGFPKAERRLSSKQWYEAAISCLDLADYMSNLHAHSVQTILVLGLSAHSIGLSKKQSVVFGAASRIAQQLGLQRLAIDPALDGLAIENAGTSQSRVDLLIKRETGRRIWSQICAQDWLAIPAYEIRSINKQHCTTIKPRRIDDDSMTIAEDPVSLGTDFGNYMYEVASVMAELHDATTHLNEPTAQYAQVLKYDSRLVGLGTGSILFNQVDEAFRPRWVWWARAIANIMHAHCIIMIHRKFLLKSFNDPVYASSRWAAISASKTIIWEVEAGCNDEERPALWNVQAYLAAAGITLCLDVLHRSESEPEYSEHRHLVEQATRLLGKYDDSVLAQRSIRLLTSLLQDGTKSLKLSLLGAAIPSASHESAVDQSKDPTPSSRRGKRTRKTVGDLNTSELLQQPDNLNLSNPASISGNTNNHRPNISWMHLIADHFPAGSGFENPLLIDELLRS